MTAPIVNAIAEALKAGKFPARKFGKREDKLIESVLASTPKVVSATWDFSVNGGGIGSVSLSASLPAGACVTGVTCDVQTQLAGSGTLKLKTADGDLSATLSSSDAVGTPSKLATSPKKTTQARALQAEVAGAVLTAGKVTFWVTYV